MAGVSGDSRFPPMRILDIIPSKQPSLAVVFLEALTPKHIQRRHVARQLLKKLMEADENLPKSFDDQPNKNMATYVANMIEDAQEIERMVAKGHVSWQFVWFGHSKKLRRKLGDTYNRITVDRLQNLLRAQLFKVMCHYAKLIQRHNDEISKIKTHTQRFGHVITHCGPILHAPLTPHTEESSGIKFALGKLIQLRLDDAGTAKTLEAYDKEIEVLKQQATTWLAMFDLSMEKLNYTNRQFLMQKLLFVQNLTHKTQEAAETLSAERKKNMDSMKKEANRLLKEAENLTKLQKVLNAEIESASTLITEETDMVDGDEAAGVAGAVHQAEGGTSH